MSTTSMASNRRIPFRKGFIALTLVLLVYVSFEAFRPEQRGGLDLMHLDKLLHFAAFASLAVPARLSAGQTWRAAAAVVAGLLLYGGFIEVVQAFIPGRDSSWLDLGADAVGIAAGMALATALRRLPPLRLEPQEKKF